MRRRRWRSATFHKLGPPLFLAVVSGCTRVRVRTSVGPRHGHRIRRLRQQSILSFTFTFTSAAQLVDKRVPACPRHVGCAGHTAVATGHEQRAWLLVGCSLRLMSQVNHLRVNVPCITYLVHILADTGHNPPSPPPPKNSRARERPLIRSPRPLRPVTLLVFIQLR